MSRWHVCVSRAPSRCLWTHLAFDGPHAFGAAGPQYLLALGPVWVEWWREGGDQ